MNVRYKKQFLRDLNNLPEHIKKKIQTIVFERIPEAATLQEVNGLKNSRVMSIISDCATLNFALESP